MRILLLHLAMRSYVAAEIKSFYVASCKILIKIARIHTLVVISANLMIKRLFSIALLFLTLSCNKEMTPPLVPVQYSEPMEELSDLVESIQIFPLETNHLFVSWQAEVLVDDDKYYVLDKDNIHLYSYNKEGCFTGTIGARGNGPGEYANIYNVQLVDNEVWVYSYPDVTIHHFDLNGKFLGKEKIDYSGQQFYKTSDGLLAFHGYGTPALCKASVKRQNKQTDFCPFKSSVIAFDDPNSVFSENEGVVFIREQLDRTIYSYDRGRMIPWVTFDFGKFNIDEDFYDLDYSASAKYLMESDYCMLTRYQESDGIKFVEWIRPIVRECGYGLYLNGAWMWFMAGKEEQDPFAGAIKLIHDGDLVCLMDPSLFGKVDTCFLQKIKNPDVLASLKETDNYIIVRMKIN